MSGRSYLAGGSGGGNLGGLFNPKQDYSNLMRYFNVGQGQQQAGYGQQPVSMAQNTPNNLYGTDTLTSDENAKLMGIPADGGLGNAPTPEGFNWDGLAAGIGAGADLFNAYTAWQGLGLAKDAFAHQKGVDTTNIGNQVASLRTAEADRNAYRSKLYGSGAVTNNTDWKTLG